MLKSISNKFILCLSFIVLITAQLNAANCSKKAFDIKIKEDTSSAEIISQLSKVCNFSIVYKDNYSKGILSIKQDGISIKNMHINSIFDLLIKEQGLDYTFSGDILKIQGLLTKTFKLDYITSIRRGSAITKANVESQSSGDDSSSSSSSSDSDNMIETKEEFDFWKNIGKEVSDIIQNSGKNIPIVPPTINSNAGLITVTSSQEILDRIQLYLDDVQESLKKQVVIDVSIIQVGLNKSHKTGIDWTQFNLGFDTTGQNARTDGTGNALVIDGPDLTVTNPIWGQTGITFGDGAWGNGSSQTFARMGINITGMINFLKESGDVKIVSSPKIATLNNQQALITVGDTYNYKLKGSSTTTDGGSTTGDADEEKSIFVGILLNILPEISDDNKIMLRINPSISELLNPDDKKVKNGHRVVAPDTKQKKLSTVVQVRDGETIVLGGLITENDRYAKNGIPVLQDIPLLGRLFGSTSKTKERVELVFVITPHIIDFTKEVNAKKSLEDLGYSLAIDYDKGLKPVATKNSLKSKKDINEFDSIQ